MKKVAFLKHYPIVIEQDKDGYFIVSCALFAGCHSYGASIDEAMENIKEVIALCEEEQKEVNQQVNTFIGMRDLVA